MKTKEQIHAELDAIPIDRVGEIWKNWRRANGDEAEFILCDFVNKAFATSFEEASKWLANKVSEKTGVPIHLVQEYQRIHDR